MELQEREEKLMMRIQEILFRENSNKDGDNYLPTESHLDHR